MNRTLALTTSALVVAVLFAPGLLASLVGGYAGVGALRDALPDAVTGSWLHGDGSVAGELADAVSFWATFHVVKALAAALLLAVLVVAVRRARRGPGRAALVALAALAAVVAIVNVQGAVAPLSSLLSMVPAGTADAVLAADRTPAFTALVHDFAVYHLAVAVLAGGTAVAVAFLAARSWRHGRRAAAGCATAAVALLALVSLANVSTVAAPEPALREFLEATAAQR
ncbi:hypothetical protein ACJ5H2_04025 [Nocardioides sp. R1-1]|uniref:hypothetical protein n=1 Tax=Nocardioides sp. R1-1 TaxID=3383502 RepID=UPI0038D22759